MRGARMLMTVIPRLNEIDRIGESPIRSEWPRLDDGPGLVGRVELRTTIGMPARTSGCAVAGCSTLAPNVASSAASS